MKIFFRYLLLFFPVLFFSCSKETVYQFEVNNNTNFKIEKIQFGCAVDVAFFSVDEMGQNNITLNYEKVVAGFFSEPLLCITVLNYSDSINQYENTIGGVHSIGKLKKNKINIMNIDLDAEPFYETQIFKISINK